MRAVACGLVGAVVLMATTSAPTTAQERHWWGWAFEETREARDAGPPFCRNGRGHPVHGWAWCRAKGFGVAAAPRVIWRRHDWGAPHFRTERRDPRRALVRGVDLRIVLGDLAYGRLARHGDRLGLRHALVGRWHHPDRRTRVLQVRSGPFPVAELSDLDGDGRVDVVLLAGR